MLQKDQFPTGLESWIPKFEEIDIPQSLLVEAFGHTPFFSEFEQLHSACLKLVMWTKKFTSTKRTFQEPWQLYAFCSPKVAITLLARVRELETKQDNFDSTVLHYVAMTGYIENIDWTLRKLPSLKYKADYLEFNFIHFAVDFK